VGISISPLGEHALYADYNEGIFATFFKRGLNVSLSTGEATTLSLSLSLALFRPNLRLNIVRRSRLPAAVASDV
jgi:hypothetical protein